MRQIPLPAPFPEKKKGEKVLLEKDVESAVCTFARREGFWCKKFASPNARGVPDRIFKISGAPFIFIEFKRPGGAVKFPSNARERLQLREHKRIQEQGGLVLVIDNIEAGKDVLLQLKHNANMALIRMKIGMKMEGKL